MLWVFPVATVWSMTILESDTHFGIVIAAVAWPVLWLVDLFMKSLGSPWMSSNLVAAIATCIIGTGIMAVVGFLQDLLHVPSPRRIVASYLIALLALFFLVPYISWLLGVSGLSAVMLTTLVAVLVVFCNFVSLFGIGSIAVYVVVAIIKAR
jgi:hypothetical protein